MLRTVAPPARDLEDTPLGRCEAEAIFSRAVATDPYAEWLARREAERRREERPEIRWVYRYPPKAGKLGSTGRVAREALHRGPGSPEDGLVSVS